MCRCFKAMCRCPAGLVEPVVLLYRIILGEGVELSKIVQYISSESSKCWQ